MLKEGEKFGRLTVVGFFGYSKGKKRLYKCICSCSNKECIVFEDNLRRNHTQSCGCLKTERMQQASTIHGETRTRFYKIWSGMKTRCNNEKAISYPNYGGRGVKVCEEWSNYENFRDDMYESYQKHVNEFGEKNTSLDRIDINGNYCKENCRWSTIDEQANNKRVNKYITYKGETHTVKEWSTILGINYHTFHNRIKHGWSIERAFTEKIRTRGG